MSLITETVEVGLNGQTVPYYRALGYDIPMHKDKNGKMVFIRNAKITVKVSDLCQNSSVYVYVKCDKCGKISKMLYKDYLTHNHEGKTYCKKCAYELFMTGSNNPAWNKNKTDEERILGRNYPEYKDFIKKVLLRDNYTCQCCGKYAAHDDIEVHHLEGYDWCEEKRTDVSNGISLCSKCHSNFHSIYGYGGNTKTQFEEWISKTLEILDFEGEIQSTRKIICIDDGEIFDSAESLAGSLGIKHTTQIYACCKGDFKVKSVKGKHYLYKDIYDSMSKYELNEYIKECNTRNMEYSTGKDHVRARKVICLNTLEVFDCIKDAEAKYNASGISSCCRGVSKTSGYSEELQTRLSWMYYENYLNDKLKQKEES